MFVCGPTVQNYIHLGHARTYTFYDVVARYLTHLGYKVKFVLNITDLDERITEEARKAGTDPITLARTYAKYFVEDMAKLRTDTICKFEPVSKHIGMMIQQVSQLIARGHAYAVDGWVYFDVSTFPAYGRLSHLSARELALRPLELSDRKKNLLDFALWRPETLVEGEWESPWGLGSPGWHIQDTAVASSLLGPRYDIHGGAYELIYPHHEAEIAEAESLTGVSPYVKYWVHTSLLNMNGEKMSKSAGNVYTLRDALERYSADQLRTFFLSHHYRKDTDLHGLAAAARKFNRLRLMADRSRRAVGVAPDGHDDHLLNMFLDAMNDDFNTPRAIKILAEGLEALSASGGRKAALKLASIRTGSNLLGIDLGLG